MATSSENQAKTSHSAAESVTLTLKFVVPVSAAVKNMVDEGCAADAIPLTVVDASTLSKIITTTTNSSPAEEEQIRKEYEWAFQKLDED